MAQVIAVGLLVLTALMLLGRLFVSASPATLARLVKGFGLGLLVVLFLLLVVSGRLSLVFAFLAALLPWLVRLAQLHSLWRYFRNAFGGGGWHPAGTAGPDTSRVETRWLRMILDHDSGRLDGEVLDGPFRGRTLSELSIDEARRLHHDIRGDVQSCQLMEAWLDRVHPDWRDDESAPPPEPPPTSARMSRDEAYAILGLRPGAPADEIKAAHHRLMRTCHPDHGGSDWLAARLNQAKDVLLDE